MNRHLYPQIRTVHVLSVIAVFAISAGILLAAQSGCIGATLAGTDGSYDTPDTELFGHAPVQEVMAGERMTDLSVACQIADTFADMLFTGMLDIAYAVHEVLSLTATSQITDTTDLVLNGAYAITTFESGSDTYAVVVARNDDGIQILNITDPSMITAAGNFINTNVLDAAQNIVLFESGSDTYAAVTALSDAVQILNITDPYMITAAGHIVDTEGANELLLNGAAGITTFVSGSDTYAAVTATIDNGVQILNITDPYMITAAGRISDTSGSTGPELRSAQSITTFVSGGDTYAAVTAPGDDSVQILNITDPYMITAAGHITDPLGNTGLDLDGAYGITTFVSGGDTYAAVTARDGNGVQILNITDPYMITAAGHINDPIGHAGLVLDSARRITTFESGGGHIYAALASFDSDGIQILDVTDPPNIVLAGNITDDGTNTDILELNGAIGITTFKSGGHIYAAVASFIDDGVQIIRIDIPTSDTTAPSITLTGSNYITITVDDEYKEQGAVCKDNVDAEKPATVGGDTVDTATARTYSVDYSCTDAAGNDATQVSRTVTVIEPVAAFITTWTATDSDKSITLPMKGMYSILWGDGSNSTNVSDSQSHTYGVAGNYTVTVTG